MLPVWLVPPSRLQLTLAILVESTVSLTGTRTAVLGPALLTTLVYVTVVCPGTAVPPLVLLVPAENVPPTLSVFLIDTSACGVTLSLPVALPISGALSVQVTPAVLTRLPVAPG